MAGVDLVLIALILIFGFYTAWNIGANDVANAMGTSVGSGALTLTMAVILAAIFEFLGAYVVGAEVSDTVRKKMFDPAALELMYDEFEVTGILKNDREGVNNTTTLDFTKFKNKEDVQRFTGIKVGDNLELNTKELFSNDQDLASALNITPERAKGLDIPMTFQATEVVEKRLSHYYLACGMIASLIAAGTWLLMATWAGWPVSTTHSIVGAVVGFGCVALGFNGIEWSTVGVISAGWIVSPLISGAIAYVVFNIILKTVFYKRDPVRAAKQVTPWLVSLVLLVLVGVTTYKGLKPVWKKYGMDPKSFEFVIWVAVVSVILGTIGFFVTRHLLRNYESTSKNGSESNSNPVLDADVSRSLAKATMHLQRVRNSSDGEAKKQAEQLLADMEKVAEQTRERITTNTDSDDLRQVEKIFVFLQILTACLVAFAHGSNDVANAIGPLSAAYQAIESGAIQAKSSTPGWALALGGVGIVIGLATWGWRVIRTVGKRITELTPSRGFCAEFGAAITILVASTMGLPLSTTHTLVGAVLGVGLARGIGALNLKTMRDIVAGWAITIPAGALLSVIFYFILKAIFIDSGWVEAG